MAIRSITRDFARCERGLEGVHFLSPFPYVVLQSNKIFVLSHNILTKCWKCHILFNSVWVYSLIYTCCVVYPQPLSSHVLTCLSLLSLPPSLLLSFPPSPLWPHAMCLPLFPPPPHVSPCVRVCSCMDIRLPQWTAYVSHHPDHLVVHVQLFFR